MVDNDDEPELELEDECDGLVAPELGAADDQVRVQRLGLGLGLGGLNIPWERSDTTETERGY